MRQTCKMEKVEVIAGMTAKEIHEGFMKKLGNVSPSYSTAKNLRVGERTLRMMQGLAAQKTLPLMKMWRSMCGRRRDLRRIDSEVGIMFWGSANNSNRYLGYVQGLGNMGTENVD